MLKMALLVHPRFSKAISLCQLLTINILQPLLRSILIKPSNTVPNVFSVEVFIIIKEMQLNVLSQLIKLLLLSRSGQVGSELETRSADPPGYSSSRENRDSRVSKG